MKFDVIASEPGFNKFSLIASGLSEEELGPFLQTVMCQEGRQAKGSPKRHTNVTVHAHPTFWTEYDWVYDCRKDRG